MESEILIQFHLFTTRRVPWTDHQQRKNAKAPTEFSNEHQKAHTKHKAS